MNENTLAKRFLLARERLGLTQKQLADQIGISQSAINKIEAGLTSKPRDIFDLAKALKVSVEWLKDGNGTIDIPMMGSQSTFNLDNSYQDKPEDLIIVPVLSDLSFANTDGTHNDKNATFIKFSKSTLSLFNASSDDHSIFCILIRDKSMEPSIPEGSTVTINANDKHIIDGKVFAIDQSGWKRLKIVYRTAPNRVSLQSYNSNYPPEEVSLDEIHIIGRAVQIMIAI